MAEVDLELARQVGAPWVMGRAIRILAELDGPDRIDMAREAVGQLEQASARLELAKAHMTLAAALAEAGLRAEAEPELAAGMELARKCGAAGLARLGTPVPTTLRRATATGGRRR